MAKWLVAPLAAAAATLVFVAGAQAAVTAQFTRDSSDSTGRGLALRVTNQGPGDITELRFVLNDNAEHTADAYSISDVIPTTRCSPVNQAGQPHGVICSWNAGEFPQNGSMDITFRTSLRYPDLAGGKLLINSTPPEQDVPGPPQPPNDPPTAQFTAAPSPSDPLGIFLDGTASRDPDGIVETYSWNFGDGQTGSGSQTAHSYAQPGTYTVTLTVTDDRGATATTSHTVTVSASPAPAGGGPKPPKLTDTEKKVLLGVAGVTAPVGAGCIYLAAATAGTGAGLPLAGLFFLLGTGLGAASGASAALADDPPDPNFHTVAQPAVQRLPKVRPGGGVPPTVAKAANALVANLAREIALANATVTAINRASGASAAGDSAALAMQRHAAAGFAGQAADTLDADVKFRARLVKAIRTAHMRTFRVSAKQARTLVAQVKRSGLPKPLLRLAQRLKVPRAAIARLANSLAKAHPRAISFPAALASSTLAKREHASATALRQFAKANRS